MEVKIGIQNVGREIVLESAQDADAVAKLVADAIGQKNELRLTDDKGRVIIVPFPGSRGCGHLPGPHASRS
ncbi:DUF3107 domain-containing protein [Pseudarthrobacter sp. J64]|uniref:DUF3107 domain-containing protein n=1 Tax=Pseudarthrobacter sp. J64 TaxID=3116485 RepID=UPI002E8158A6|nr:DUF3107 domain-containing protein [Pseudarthrobacter sp. J64]MEE2568240.1 DUF3107 domain-containing protein [Pseudarthrobacter sp. J64]